MIDDELFAKFDSIQDLPVSEEMLGAYLEANLTSEESAVIENIQLFNRDFASFVDSVANADYQGLANEINFFEENMIDSEGKSLFIDDNLIYRPTNHIEMYSSNDSILNSSLGASAASRLYGEESNGTSPNQDPLIFQGNEGVCAIRSQQIILRDYGIDIPLEDLKQFAIQNGWYDPSGDGGTPMACVGAILASCGVEVRQDINCTVYDLVNELAQGHRIIVGVDADELWADRSGSIIDKTTTWLNDVFGNEHANHALIVAGVEVNPNDPNDVKVILTDPGTGDLRLEYSLDEFMDAWEDSDCFMVTTTTPAPYQYDPVHGCEVPSNFAVEQYIAYNSLPLNLDVRGVELPSDYSAYYAEGHLDVVGTDGHGNDISYDKFHSEFSKLKQSLGGMPGTLGQDHFDKNEFMSSLKSLFGSHHEPTVKDYLPIQEPEPEPEPEPGPEPAPNPELDSEQDEDIDYNY